MKDKDVKKRIFKAALKEFSQFGFPGARMDRIAAEAKANKAMIFYYFSSKQNLYQLIIKEVFDRSSPMLIDLITADPSPEEFMEQVTRFYVGIYHNNPEFVRMMVLELIQNPRNIITILMELLKTKGEKGPPQIFKLIGRWQQEGLISEPDPFQFMLNVISLSLLSFIGKPFLEAMFRLGTGESPDKKNFNEKRIESVVQLLKRGMLT